MATPPATEVHAVPPGMHNAADHKPVHIQHYYSWAPLLLGIGSLVLFVGLEFIAWNDIPVFPVLGVIIVFAAFFVWVKEDVGFWNANYQDPGVLPGKHGLEWWGLLFFLGTEVMLFGGLFAYYFVGNASLPAVFDEATQLPLVLTGINTAILVASSFTLHFGEVRLKKYDDRKGWLAWLIVTIALGVVFLGFQVNEYIHLIADGNVLSKNAFWSIFYQLTGTHGAHVFLGLSLLVILLIRTLLGQFNSKRHEAVDVFSIYWHFVDVVWVFLFLVIYVLPYYGVI